VTNETAIGLNWVQGGFNGGTPVIDYRLYYDQGIGSFVVFSSGITTNGYTSYGMTPGTTY
jgi:hypothetical protein